VVDYFFPEIVSAITYPSRHHANNQKHPLSLSSIYPLPGAELLEPVLSEERSNGRVTDKEKGSH
jgi:hypothetical protein